MSCEPPDRVHAELQWANALLLMREIARIQFMESFAKFYAPGIAKELIRLGVKFPKKGWSKNERSSKV